MSSAAGPLLSPRKCMTGPSPVGLTSVRDPDGDMRAARLGHRCAVPVGPAIAQSKTRETSHEVKLGGPHVAERHRAAFDAAVGPSRGVMRGERLRRDVVLVHADVPGGHLVSDEALTGGQ